MKRTVSYEVWSRNESLWAGIEKLVSFAKERGRRLLTGSGIQGIRFRFEGEEFNYSENLDAVRALLTAREEAPVSWSLMANMPKNDESDYVQSLTVFIDVEPIGALVTVGADDVDVLSAAQRAIETAFAFQKLPRGLPEMIARPHATALIGCHFDNEGKGAAARLQRFLSLIGFARVDIADRFLGDPIPEKVRMFLDRNDFYIGVVSGKRDHAWITSESSYAMAKRKHVILVRGPGVTFDPTLYGRDREHLRFTYTIDEVFIGLLEYTRARVVGF